MTHIPDYPPLRLKRNEERRLRAGHLWIFSNEVDVARTPLDAFEPGQPVIIEGSDGHALGSGYVNPRSLIAARLVVRGQPRVLDEALLVTRIGAARALRDRLFERPFYRAVYGDSDALPGLVVDRYGEMLVAQITTAGMERLRAEIVAALVRVFTPVAILWRNDSSMRALEGLPSAVEPAYGEVPEDVVIEEEGARFRAPLLSGQKTGWYFDQRDNRSRLARYVRGARVLDLFSYVGAWGVRAALMGAREVYCVDASQRALTEVHENARLNGVEDRIHTRHGEGFEVLAALREAGERFDVVILDPPAFIRRKRDHAAGMEAYARLNRLAMRLMGADGILVSCSCSYHLARDDLKQAISREARRDARSLQILEQGQQAPDHPVHPAIPETEYLKALFCRVASC